jgi:hypothetical protein
VCEEDFLLLAGDELPAEARIEGRASSSLSAIMLTVSFSAWRSRTCVIASASLTDVWDDTSHRRKGGL